MTVGVRAFDAARYATVRICDRLGKHKGQGLLLDIEQEGRLVLTCHHVVAPLSAADLCVAVRQEDGIYSPPQAASYDSERSKPSMDAVVLRVGGLSPRQQPLLHALNPAAYSGTLPGRATTITCSQPDTFDARVGAATTLQIPVVEPGKWPDPPKTYVLNNVFRLADPTDSRPGISGSVVTYENGVLGLAHFSRPAGADQQREVYLVPLSVWASGWAALSALIQPLVDERLRNAATVLPARAFSAELEIAGFLPEVYLDRPMADIARRALRDKKVVMIVGKPGSGKTRLAWELLKQWPEAIVIRPNRADPPEQFEVSTFAGQDIALVLDDLHRVAATYNPVAWRKRFAEITGDRCRLICTSRDGADWRAVRSAPGLGTLLKTAGPQGCVFLSAGQEGGEDLSESEGQQLAAALQIPDSEFHRRFDGTPGSLTLDLHEMRERYDRLAREFIAEISMACLLDSAKLLYEASQPQLTVSALRATAERICAARPVGPGVWRALCQRTQEEGFGEIKEAENRFQVYKPYLENCVSYAPSKEDFARLVPVLKEFDDVEGLSYLAKALYMRLSAYETAEQAIRARMELRGATPADEHELAGVLARVPGRQSEAENYYRQRVRAGEQIWVDFGNFLKDQGRYAEAEQAFREAIRTGPKEEQNVAYANLGLLLLNQPPRWAEAEDALRRPLRDGWYILGVFLADLLISQPGREREAEQALHECLDAMEQNPAIEGGAAIFGKSLVHPTAELHAGFKPRLLFALGDLLTRDPNRIAEAKQAYRAAIELGSVEALVNLGAILAREGSQQEAEELFKRAVDSGSSAGYTNLAVLFAKEPARAKEAEALFREAIRGADPVAPLLYGHFLARQRGRESEAEQVFRSALHAGIKGAQIELGNTLASDPKRRAEAIQAYEAAVQEGDMRGAYNLGLLLASCPEDRQAAEEAFRSAAAAGIAKAHRELGRLLFEQTGRESEAEEAYRNAVQAGIKGARAELGDLLASNPKRRAEAIQAYEAAVQEGDMRGAYNLGLLLASCPEDRQAAEEAFRSAAAAGVAEAHMELGRLLCAQTGRESEAEEHLRRGSEAGLAEATYMLGLFLVLQTTASDGRISSRTRREEGLQQMIRAAAAGEKRAADSLNKLGSNLEEQRAALGIA
jgi:tetratricopeptide (TPR) repeat protein